MTTRVHRDGPHQITVEDGHGDIARFVTVENDHGHQLQVEQTGGAQPQRGPDAVVQLAAELDQWATTAYTRPCRSTRHR